MGLRKRLSATTGGCEASEADPVERGETLSLRSSAPTFPRGRFLRDPAADDPHGSSADKVVWKMMLFGQRGVRGRRMKKGAILTVHPWFEWMVGNFLTNENFKFGLIGVFVL